MSQVNDYLRLGALLEDIFVVAAASSDREPRRHRRTVQIDGVEARRSSLEIVREMRGVGVAVESLRSVILHRHHEHVAEVIAARTVEVRVAEAVDERIGVVVAGAAVPVAAARTRVGAELHHTERPDRTRESVPGEVRSDHRRHVRSGIRPRSARKRRNGQQAGQCRNE